MNTNLRALSRTMLFFLAISILGCATTQQAREVKRSGFLGDYAELKPGKDGQALLVYKNPRAAWGMYTKVMIDPVSVYMTKDAELKDDSRAERADLVNYFHASLYEELRKNFVIVKTPGKNVLRVSIALTDGDQSEVLLDTFSTVMPIGLALSAVKRVAAGSDTAVGFAQAEAEVTDSLTGERLAAAVDKRYGTKALRSKFGSWNHAKEAMEHWSSQISERLVEWGAGVPE